GTAEAWDTMHNTLGLADIWQLHFAVEGGPHHNSAGDLIANMTEANDKAYGIRLVAHRDGHFEITNERNRYMKKY
ncbi:MAG: MBL fold metallo-hydrolase, partial [Acidobacteriota bacterium]|nr:MBL fold metallo-hydrolase [Acidobacteriota bacterium]